ncbi:ExbD/TolR family protein [Aestuariibaculum suncheonense]|uniref:Biopolymer transporter ExbD n=1 Tax=Aestuariibaculum suncheonense TaxID=1028745 RepID=A0A8J6UGY5_9FLAO|nr:biopolymer transporter ExbD [Aestuariibaculum suncheonense]MBD0835454.1 biopolymer transporter ExbD [Aestuariibaculum suncheonense]
MRLSKQHPEVNAGSMADIAFLLLIFFLVTATISSDEGINRKLPAKCPPGVDCESVIPERNLFRIAINNKDEIMVEDKIIPLDALKDLTKAFIDNNGSSNCAYCRGSKDESGSDHPSKAIISLQTHPQATYNRFIQVQDRLTAAYYELRNDYCVNVLKKAPNDLTPEELKQAKEAYPFIISEAETK